MKILVFGNLLVEKDNLALRLVPKLKKIFPEIEFKEFDPTEDLGGEIENRKLMILDVAEGIDDIKIIDNLEKLQLIKSCSMHDFDLAYNLKLLKKIGKIDNVKIIVMPIGLNVKKAINQIQFILRKWVAQDIQGS